MMDLQAMFKQFVVVGGDSDEFSIIFEMENVGSKPSVPFKLISIWMKEGEFVQILNSWWDYYDESSSEFGINTICKIIKKGKRGFSELVNRDEAKKG